jgi:hypothetical protein
MQISDDIMFYIIPQYIDHETLYKITRCNKFYHENQYKFDVDVETKMAYRLYKNKINPKMMDKFLIKYGGCISGSFPLQVLLDKEWSGSDIDIYIPYHKNTKYFYKHTERPMRLFLAKIARKKILKTFNKRIYICIKEYYPNFKRIASELMSEIIYSYQSFTWIENYFPNIKITKCIQSVDARTVDASNVPNDVFESYSLDKYLDKNINSYQYAHGYFDSSPLIRYVLYGTLNGHDINIIIHGPDVITYFDFDFCKYSYDGKTIKYNEKVHNEKVYNDMDRNEVVHNEIDIKHIMYNEIIFDKNNLITNYYDQYIKQLSIDGKYLVAHSDAHRPLGGDLYVYDKKNKAAKQYEKNLFLINLLPKTINILKKIEISSNIRLDKYRSRGLNIKCIDYHEDIKKLLI